MGRRSINTTKSGKYMNPTDQARKEARKKELKKNKRQRQMVRAAVLKMKDPDQILDELQKIDEMEYNVLQPSPLNEKVLKEKRKKLKETFERVLKMYDKDEPEKWIELKRQENEYEKKQAHLISYYESVKHAQSVQIDEIPLPTLQVPDNLLYGNVPSQIPLPVDPGQAQQRPILKKNSAYLERPSNIEPPGVPPGPPPSFAKLIEEAAISLGPDVKKHSVRFAGGAEEELTGEVCGMPRQLLLKMQQTVENMNKEKIGTDESGICLPGPPGLRPLIPPGPPPGLPGPPPGPPPHAGALVPPGPPPGPPGGPPGPPAATPKPTSLQQRMLALSGQNIDEFMKEMEEVHKKRERDRAADLNARLTALKRKDRRDSDSDSDAEQAAPAPRLMDSLPAPPGTAPLPPPDHAPLGVRPPPLRALPPPLRLPPGPPPGLPRLLRPPGPPPGAPPRLLRPLMPPMPPMPPPPAKAPPPVSVLTAAPQLLPKKDGPQGATISAKPQIRNLSADVTRFVPSALRVKREDKKHKPIVKTILRTEAPKQVPTKDDAYMQFMREMEGLL